MGENNSSTVGKIWVRDLATVELHLTDVCCEDIVSSALRNLSYIIMLWLSLVVMIVIYVVSEAMLS
ncbi:hypothetical protein C5167_029053 [Papaver somniferum]|nr:hypothetical protein C5167_029053 [Papaver somniferum]